MLKAQAFSFLRELIPRASWNRAPLLRTAIVGMERVLALVFLEPLLHSQADLTLQGVNKIAKLNMYNFALDADGTLALAGGGPWAGFGSLNAGALAGATLDLDGGLPGAGLTLADSRSNLGALIGNSILGINGSLYITNTGGLNRQMTMAYNVPFVVLINGLPLNGSFEANIVSTASVPEPASVGLVGLAVIALCLEASTTGLILYIEIIDRSET
jgi:hypothetical protein